VTEPPRPAAVLVPVFRDAAGEARVVLVRRTEGGLHGGQLAFPGGMREATDASALATALREAHEEIGLEPASVRVLAELPIFETLTTGYRIEPFLARIARPAAWRPAAAEVAEVLEPGLADLARPEAHAETLKEFSGWPAPRRVPCLRVGPFELWGASYRILLPLLPRLLAGEWEI
jgi:8-oxo-dGTP pyrophosphatase MutT (NUDIX family)